MKHSNFKKRAMTSEQARKVRQKGHDDAREFAKLIGLKSDYKNDPKAKKDVIDLSGDAHSVKSGKKKWQIFLYSLSRFENDTIFKRLNGLGQLLLKCLKVFPDSFEDYKKDKQKYKNMLRRPMKELKQKLQIKDTLRVFLEKSFFNAGEVTYLTIKNDNSFHVFHSRDVVKILTDNIIVKNSKGEQKVIFKIKNTKKQTLSRFPYITIGEIEVRNDSTMHYREIKFWMSKKKTFTLLISNSQNFREVKNNLFVYGKALRTFHNF